MMRKIPVNGYELFNALGRSRSALSSNLEQILSWFTRSEIALVDKFDFDTAVEIAMRSANIKVSFSQNPQYEFEGRSLTFFVDILYILFENAISKSNIAKDEVNIKVSLTENSNSNIVLAISNNCSIIDSIEESNKKLNFYRDSYGKDKIIKDNVQGEGGTGFFKICKILTKDLDVRHTNEFGYDDENNFSVNITIIDTSKVIRYENTNC